MMTRGFANAKPPKPQHSWEGIEDDAPPVLEQQGLAPRMGSSIGKNGAKSPWFSRKKKTKKTMVFDRKKNCKSTSNPTSMLRVSLTHMLLIGGFQIWTQKVKESIYR